MADVDDAGVESEVSQPAGLDEAVLDLRTAAYCTYCDRIVERMPDGSCPAGHPAASLAGRIVLGPDDEVPQLPRFNIAAFLIPPIWGPAHGQWVGAVFLPIWLFMDSIIASARTGGAAATVVAAFVVAATFAFQAFFAKRANGLAFRRLRGRMSVAEYTRRERVWAIAAIPVAALLVAWAVWFRVTH